jgi:UMF1 family MFS transporter
MAILGWSIYDWANSAFATTVMAGFFPIFFKDFWSVGVEAPISTARLGFASSLASIVVALIAPIIGSIADRGSAKKKFLVTFTYLGVLATMGLYFVAMGEWVAAATLYVLAFIGFSASNIFYDSLLTSVASEKRVDVVSSLGYALGYLGGGLLFALNVWMTINPSTFGLEDAAEAVQLSFVMVGVWWALFTIPLMVFVKEPVIAAPAAGFGMVKAGLRQLADTFREIRHLRTIFLFLLAYWLYIDGVDTVIRMAVDYGRSLGFETQHLILALLITQFVGFPAAIAFGYLAQRIGTKSGILIAIVVYLFVSIWGAFMKDQNEFYILAVVVGLVQGGVQALSRSFYARIIPPNKSAEYFGFYNMLGKFAAIFGPALMGGVGLFASAAGFDADTASRLGIASIAVLFLGGGATLLFVNEERGKAEVAYLSREKI